MNTIGSFDCSCRVEYSGDCTKGNCDGMLYIFYNTKCIQYVQVVSYKWWTFLCFLHFVENICYMYILYVHVC